MLVVLQTKTNPKLSSVIDHHSQQCKNGVNAKQHIACESYGTNTGSIVVNGKNTAAGSPVSKQIPCSNNAKILNVVKLCGQVYGHKNSSLLHNNHSNSQEITCNVKYVSEEGSKAPVVSGSIKLVWVQRCARIRLLDKIKLNQFRM